MSIRLVKLTDDAVELNDLGITVSGLTGTIYDLTDEQANDIHLSATGGDLEAAINGTAPFIVPELVLEDPRDGATGNLNAADSLAALRAANDVHFGIRGAVISDLDDVTGTPNANDVLQFSGGTFSPVPPSTIAGSITLNDLSDVDDATAHTAGTVYVFKGDGTNLDVVDFTTDTDVTEAVQDIIGGTFQNGTDTTFVYNDVAGTMQVDVNDAFLRNTGDTLDSGTLTIASGASIAISSGADLTIADAPVNPTDATNKEYVDSVASGLDPKESVRGSTVSDIGGTYNPTGGTGGTGSFTNIDLTSDAIFDGVPTAIGGYQIGDRILVKDQASSTQNGIYVVTATGATGSIERAPDHDGTPSNEVSGGNFTFVENGTTLASTGWVLQGDGTLVLNTDPIVWVQFSENSTFTAGDGLALTGNEFSLDINNLTAATIATTDEIAFNDVSDADSTRNTTVANFLADLDIPNAITADGFVVRTAADTYASRSITVDGLGALDGLAITNGNGVSGDPVIGLDIQNLPARSDAIDGSDRIAVYNLTSGANEYYTVTELANAGAANAFGIIIGDTGTATADSPSDTVTFTGNGITTTATAGAAAAVDFALDISDLAAGAGTIDLGDSLAVGEGASTVRYTFTDLVQDLDIPNGFTTNGVLVRTGSDTYASRTIAVSGAGAEDGLTITNGDGVAGNPTVGLDITGSPAAGEDLAATDELIVYNASGTANEKMTGQEVADGVSTILGLGGLTVTTIGGQEVLTLVDTTRANKVLSVETTAVTWSENRIGNNDWIDIGGAVDSTSGYVIPLNATIVKVTAQTADDNNIAKDIHLYVNGTLTTSGIVSFSPAVNGENTFVDVTVNTDVAAGDKIRLRGASTGGTIEDVVITLWLKWRG